MKKIIPLLSLLFCFVLVNAQSSSKVEQFDILVQLQEGQDVQTFLLENENSFNQGIQLKKTVSSKFGFHLFSITNGINNESMLTSLRETPGVVSAQFDSPVQFRNAIPNDPLWPEQWHLERIGLPNVWDTTTGGTTANGDEIVVAILDSGFDLTHEDLQGNIWENKLEAQGLPNFDDDGNGKTDDINGWNFINDTPVLSVTGHGTSVSGLIGANGNNGIGLSGVNWNVKMMFLTIDLVSEVIAAFDYIIYQRELYNNTNGAEGAFIVVTNGSFGKDAVFCEEEPLWAAMYDKLGQVGVLSVAATANENWDVDEIGDMPTTCTSEFLIAVTATDTEDFRVSNAAFGPASIDLAAPGRQTSTITTQDRYIDSFGGTSSACPHVSGSIALLYSVPCSDFAALALADPPAAALLMREAILRNVTPLSSLQGKTVTGGRLEVFESMKYLHAYCIANEQEKQGGNFKEIYITQKGFVRIFPNPVSSTLQIDYSNEGFIDFSIRVFNSIGQEMEIQAPDLTTPFETQTIDIDVSDWSAGIYYIIVNGPEEEITSLFVKI